VSNQAASGNIYDLGYRNYEGARLGRRHAILTLYLSSLRSAFGLGRRASSKVFPVGLLVVAFIPAIIQLGIGALTDFADADVEIFRAEDYYGYVQVIIALFCAAVAPELVGRDQRTRTLSLYFSRSLMREDYAFAKLAALASALLLLTLGPQLLLFVGNGMVTDDLTGYIRDEWDLVLPILASAALLCSLVAAIGIAIAAQTPRRAYSTVAVLAAFLLPWTIAQIIVETAGENGRYAMFFSPFHLMRGFTFWLFDVSPENQSTLGRADMPLFVYFAAAIALTLVLVALVVRRYRGIAA
jgi:ABC-2 type transport system permease protein